MDGFEDSDADDGNRQGNGESSEFYSTAVENLNGESGEANRQGGGGGGGWLSTDELAEDPRSCAEIKVCLYICECFQICL